MKFTPKSEDQFEAEAQERAAKYLWPAKTEVDYEVNSAIEKTSKKGNEMLELSVTVYNSTGDKQNIVDYIGEWNIWKLKHICDANGLADKYAAGEVHDLDLYNKTGRCVLNVQKGGQKDDGSFYQDKNGIQDYLKGTDGAAKSSKELLTKKADDDFGDSIPF